MRYAIVEYPIVDTLLKSGLIAQTNASARVNNSQTKCIVSYQDSFASIFRGYPTLPASDLALYLSNNPKEWDPEFIPAPSEVAVSSKQAFASKVLPDGRKIFARERGIEPETVAPGAIGSLVLEIPYAAAKITDATIIGCRLGDTVNLKILDTPGGLITTIPLYPINQFGYDVNMPDGLFFKKYDYDADLFAGLHVAVEYKNNGDDPVTIYVNLGLHEVK